MHLLVLTFLRALAIPAALGFPGRTCAGGFGPLGADRCIGGMDAPIFSFSSITYDPIHNASRVYLKSTSPTFADPMFEVIQSGFELEVGNLAPRSELSLFLPLKSGEVVMEFGVASRICGGPGMDLVVEAEEAGELTVRLRGKVIYFCGTEQVNGI